MQLLKALGLAIATATLATATAVPYGQSRKLNPFKFQAAGCSDIGQPCKTHYDCCEDMRCMVYWGELEGFCVEREDWGLRKLETAHYRTRHAYRVLQGKRDIEHTELTEDSANKM
ncbi:hypothetical protein C8R43DRAFT_956141 [Mycena crocata]|nr:hypothetical protein C8R43DRAFT_956141 [Mycena crocata]